MTDRRWIQSKQTDQNGDTGATTISSRHLEHDSVQGLAELAEGDTTAGEGGPESSQVGNNSDPDTSWPLDRLEAFIRARLRHTAADAWQIGNALDIAHKQLVEDRKWLRWLQDIGISKSSAHRFRELFNSYSLEEIHARPGIAVCRWLDDPKADDHTAGGKKEKTAAVAAKRAPAETGGTSSEEEIGEEDSEGHAGREEEQQPPMTDAEYAALNSFVEVCGGWTRAEYVLREGRQQVEDVADE